MSTTLLPARAPSSASLPGAPSTRSARLPKTPRQSADLSHSSNSRGPVTHFGIFNAASASNLLLYGTLTSSRTVTTGDPPKFLANEFSLTAD